MTRHVGRWIAMAFAVLVSACGGGGGNGLAEGVNDTLATGQSTGTGGAIPSSALQSVDALIAHAGQLIAQTGDSAESLALGDAVLPTSDTAEPAALNN